MILRTRRPRNSRFLDAEKIDRTVIFVFIVGFITAFLPFCLNIYYGVGSYIRNAYTIDYLGTMVRELTYPGDYTKVYYTRAQFLRIRVRNFEIYERSCCSIHYCSLVATLYIGDRTHQRTYAFGCNMLLNMFTFKVVHTFNYFST